MIGAILARAPEGTVETLEGLGEEIGVLFQIKDDEIGLYGDQSTTGKPVGSDVREGKKTIYYTELVRRVDENDRRKLGSVFGNADASDVEIGWVKSLIESSGAKHRVDEIVDEYAKLASETIVSLEAINEHGRSMLKALLDYNMSRVR
jgi:geranylgeranyl diphosphate synthase type I